MAGWPVHRGEGQHRLAASPVFDHQAIDGSEMIWPNRLMSSMPNGVGQILQAMLRADGVKVMIAIGNQLVLTPESWTEPGLSSLTH